MDDEAWGRTSLRPGEELDAAGVLLGEDLDDRAFTAGWEAVDLAAQPHAHREAPSTPPSLLEPWPFSPSPVFLSPSRELSCALEVGDHLRELGQVLGPVGGAFRADDVVG